MLILDEPTDGLDPNQKHEVRKLIKAMAEDKAIVLSTHILEEVEAICNRIIVIDQGRVRVNETPDEFKARKPGSSIDEIFREITSSKAYSEQVLPVFKRVFRLLSLARGLRDSRRVPYKIIGLAIFAGTMKATRLVSIRFGPSCPGLS